VNDESAVVVIVIEHRNPFGRAGILVDARRTATVSLAEALGERTVLEVTQGLAVAVPLIP
jgi:hypothetical protein